MYMYVFYRLNSVEDLMANPGLMADVKDTLRVLPDLERLLKKYENNSYLGCIAFYNGGLILSKNNPTCENAVSQMQYRRWMLRVMGSWLHMKFFFQGHPLPLGTRHVIGSYMQSNTQQVITMPLPSVLVRGWLYFSKTF